MAATFTMIIPPQLWTVDDVHKYISNLQIDDFKYNDCADMFQKEIVNGQILLNLEKHDLNVLGIHQFAKRNALYQHLQELKCPPDTQNLAIKSTDSSNTAISQLGASSSGAVTPNTSNNTIKVLPPNSVNEIIVNNESINGTIASVRNSSLSNLMAFSSPIYGASITSPQPSAMPFSPNFISNALNSRSSHNILPIGILSPSKPTKMFQRLSLQNNVSNINNLSNTNTIDNNLINFNMTTKALETHLRRLPLELHVVEIPAIYQGVNSHNTAFVLMTQENIVELNEMYKLYTIIRDDGSIKSRNIFSAVQYFSYACSVEAQKVQYGWQIRGNHNKANIRLPFNPLIKFKLNILTDEIVEISPMMITGEVNHVNNYGQAWISSDLQIDAMEEVEVSSASAALINNIISLQLTNISHQSLQQRDASYMIHDPEYQHQYKWEKSLKLTFCLKLSTRTNKKNKNSRKPVFVQSWNVKPL